MRDPSIERDRVVVIFPGALGDFLLALPALRSVRARHGAAELTLVVSEPLRALAALTGVADAVVSLDGADAVGLFGGTALPVWLAGRPFVYSWLGAADEQVRARLAAGGRACFFRVERGDGRTHAAADYARAVGGTVDGRALAAAARIETAASAAVDALFEGITGPVLAIHGGAGARAKRWDAAGFVQVAQWWRAAGGVAVGIAGPAESSEAPLLGQPEVRDWPLGDLAVLLARSTLYLGHDSGVSHLAGAVGAPGIALFGPTDPRRWRPLGGRLTVLRTRARAEGISLSALPPGRVIAACRRRISLTRGSPDIDSERCSRESY